MVLLLLGTTDRGGDSSAVADDLASGVIQVAATSDAFAALKSDGTVTAWGNQADGGDASEVSEHLVDVMIL